MTFISFYSLHFACKWSYMYNLHTLQNIECLQKENQRLCPDSNCSSIVIFTARKRGLGQLKPPYSIQIGKLRLPIWETSFGTFLSNLDKRDLKTYPRNCLGYFCNMSLFNNSRAIRELFRKWVLSENQSFINVGAMITPLFVQFQEGRSLGHIMG